jgi:hypothetical protein
MAIINFNAAAVEPQQAFEPIPADWYNVLIDESEIKPTNNQNGHYLEMRLNVIDGAYANRKLYGRFNIDNPNATAVEIAYAQLSAICRAVGVMQVDDTQLLHGKPFMVKVSVRPPRDGYEASNELKGFKACDGSAAGGQAGSSTGGSGGAPAWATGNQQPAAAQQPVQTQQPWQQQAQQPAPEQQVQQTQQAVVEEQTQQAVVEQNPQENSATSGQTEAAAKKPPWVK